MVLSQPREPASFGPVLLANLLPLAGIAVFGWRAPEVLFVYWIEIGSLVVLYSGLTLFARREPRPEDRTFSPVGLPVPFVSSRSGSARPVDWLPPVYYRNVPYAAGLLVWGLGLWLCLSVLLVVLPSPEPLLVQRGSDAVPLEAYASLVAAAVSPTALGSAAVLVASQFATVSREFFGNRAYEELSAPVVVETPARQVVFWFLLIPVAEFGVPLLTLPLVDVFGTKTLTEVGVATVVVLGKLAVEWAAHRARRQEEVDGFAGWFVPEEPKSG